GIRVPDCFVITASAFKNFLKENNIDDKLMKLLGGLNKKTFSNLPQIGKACRKLMLSAIFSKELSKDILNAYHTMPSNAKNNLSVAVRSSATAEDLPTASFAGQHDSFLNIKGDK